MKNIIAQAITKIKRKISESDDIFKQNNWEKSYVSLTNDIRRQAFIEILSEIDEDYFLSEERKGRYLSKDIVGRTLVTTFGTIIFKRRKYICRRTRSSYYFVDKLLELLPYQRVSNTAVAFVLNEVIYSNLSYQKASERLGLTRSFVYTTLKKIQTETIYFKIDKPLTCDYLHVIADEDHVAVQDKNRKRLSGSTNRHLLRQITIYTDLETVCKGRNKLKNKVVFCQYENETVEDFCLRVHQFICKSYNINQEIYVYGDGATWIKTLANIVGTKFILDKFHMMQALTRICTGKRNSEIRTHLLELIKGNNKKGFNHLIETLYPNGMSDFKKKQVFYIKNNWTFYQNNFKLPNALVCSAEAINSHYFASRLSSRPMGFSIANIHKLGVLLSINASKVDISVFLQENIKALLEKKKAVRDTFKHQINQTISLPLINYKNNQTRELFKGLMYDDLII